MSELRRGDIVMMAGRGRIEILDFEERIEAIINGEVTKQIMVVYSTVPDNHPTESDIEQMDLAVFLDVITEPAN